jgi:ATP-dependent Lon protease
MTEFENINFEEILDEGLGIIAEEINFSDFDTKESDESQSLFPILPVRNMVMFPKVVIPITAGREKSKKFWKKHKRKINSSES